MLKEMIVYECARWIYGSYFFPKRGKLFLYHLPKRIRRQLIIEIVGHLLNNFSLKPRYAKRNPCKRMSLIEITNACNLNCVMCNTKLASRRIGFMSKDIFEVILRKLKDKGSKTIGLFTVGEPFLHPDIGTLLRLVDKYQFKTLLSTNGQFPHLLLPLYRSIPKLSIAYRFSIDGAVQKTYESIRLGASFNTLIESLEQIHQINEGKINSRINMFIRATLCMKNIYEIPEFFNAFGKYCLPENFDFGIIQGLSPDLTFFRREFPFKHLIRRNVPCCMPFSEMHFTYDGKATLCCRDYSGQLVIGDIREKSIAELWNGDKANEIRDMHLLGAKTGLPCDNCYFSIDSLNRIANFYIKFLNSFSRQMPSVEFGDKVIDFLWKMDSSLAKEDLSELKKCVLNAFLE